MELHQRSDRELLSDATKLVGSHCEITAKIVAILAEIEERRLHLRAGFSSMFEFCVRELRMSEGEAFRRIVAARLVQRFEMVLPRLASGALNLSILELVREHLTDENHAALLDAVSCLSKREVELLLASWFPRPDVPARIRRLPQRIEALSVERFKFEFTAGADLCEKLERCRDLMSHANPTRDIAFVFERAVELLLDKLEMNRVAQMKPPRAQGVQSAGASVRATKPGRIPVAIRRHVFERDEAQCTYVAPDGRRCEGRAFLEVDHIEPRALGGVDNAENLRVRCRAHNRLWAEDVFGRERVERSLHLRQQKSAMLAAKSSDEPRNERTNVSAELEAERTILEKVRFALKRLGFSESQVREAIVEVAKIRESTAPLTLESALRAAISIAAKRAA